jgi:hypothetical protein
MPKLTKPANTRQDNDVKQTLDEHGKKIDNQETLIKFFIIVVGLSVIATLVGILGVYLSVFGNNKDNKEELLEIQKQISENNLKIELLKANNKYLK